MEKVGASLLSLETMGTNCGADPSQPPESMQWTSALKIHPAKVESSKILQRERYVSRRCTIRVTASISPLPTQSERI